MNLQMNVIDPDRPTLSEAAQEAEKAKQAVEVKVSHLYLLFLFQCISHVIGIVS